MNGSGLSRLLKRSQIKDTNSFKLCVQTAKKTNAPAPDIRYVRLLCGPLLPSKNGMVLPPGKVDGLPVVTVNVRFQRHALPKVTIMSDFRAIVVYDIFGFFLSDGC